MGPLRRLTRGPLLAILPDMSTNAATTMHKPFERARATEARLHGYIEQALRDIGLSDEVIADLMARYEESVCETMWPVSSADLHGQDEQDTPEYVPLD